MLIQVAFYNPETDFLTDMDQAQEEPSCLQKLMVIMTQRYQVRYAIDLLLQPTICTGGSYAILYSWDKWNYLFLQESGQTLTIQERLEIIWQKLKMPDSQKLDFALKYSSDHYVKFIPEVCCYSGQNNVLKVL